jgi:hypoxanthine phosphoribosyltransferase
VVFLSDLMRYLQVPCEIDFIDISSYGAGTSSSGVVRILKDLEEDIMGRHVPVVEDIIDTGLTLSYLMRTLLARKPASLEICTLLSKPSRRQIDLDVKYLGFEVPDEFVVGYGIDYASAYRNLPDICVLKPEVFAKDLASVKTKDPTIASLRSSVMGNSSLLTSSQRTVEDV